MGAGDIDISGLCDWEEDLPHPRWDLIRTLIEDRCEPGTEPRAWTALCRQWLDELAAAFDAGYATFESPNFLGLAAPEEATGAALLGFAERCRATLLSVLGGVVDFGAAGKQVVVALRHSDDYYRYLTPYHSGGEHGRSAGVHIRAGYPHVALYSAHLWELENTLAHELTHVGLMHLSMPQWLEEGLAQMVEHDMTGRALLAVDSEMAQEHKQYWGKHRMDAFWYGDGFSRSGQVQKLSYQLAEILVRLLVEEGKPRWFGWVKEPRRRFFAFLREATADDCGASACQQHLGFGLRELAAQFLGITATPPRL
jgi:hypothetical protein